MDKYTKIELNLTVLFTPFNAPKTIRLNPYKQKYSVQFSDTLSGGVSGVVYGKLHPDAQGLSIASNTSNLVLNAIPTPILEVYLTPFSGVPRTSTVWIR